MCSETAYCCFLYSLARRKSIHIKYYFLHIYVATQTLIHTPERQCEQVAKHWHLHEAVNTQLTSLSCFILNILFSNDLLQPDEVKQNPPDLKDEHSFFGVLHRVQDGTA